MLACLKCQTLVTHVLKCYDFCFDFLLRQSLAEHGLVLGMVRTVGAAVYAVVGKVERREHHYSVAVYLFLEFFCQDEHAFVEVFEVALQKYRSFAVGYALGLFSLVENTFYEGAVVPVGTCVLHGFQNFAVVYELFGDFRFYVVHISRRILISHLSAPCVPFCYMLSEGA